MRLENILALTYGQLINSPFVNSFEDVVFEAKAVKRGDLFLAFDEADIDVAILNGAYGIIFDKPTQISDSEIAWIKVQDIKEALRRILRFHLIEKEVQAYECNEIVLKLALQVITEPNFVVVNNDLVETAKSLWHVEDKTTVLFCPALMDKELFTNTKNLPKSVANSVNIIEQTLFETSFIYDNVFYERQLLSPFFIPYLETLLHFFKVQKIKYKLRKFTPIDHFEAVFVNRNFEIKEFGTSDKVLIFEHNRDLITHEMEFLREFANWAKIIYLIPHTAESKDHENLYRYKNEKDIIETLKTTQFHFALIVGVEKSILDKPLTSQKQLLFDI